MQLSRIYFSHERVPSFEGKNNKKEVKRERKKERQNVVEKKRRNFVECALCVHGIRGTVSGWSAFFWALSALLFFLSSCHVLTLQ